MLVGARHRDNPASTAWETVDAHPVMKECAHVGLHSDVSQHLGVLASEAE